MKMKVILQIEDFEENYNNINKHDALILLKFCRLLDSYKYKGGNLKMGKKNPKPKKKE